MRLLAALFCLCICYSTTAQHLNLTSLQHQVRWLDEGSFPPFARDSAIGNDMLAYTSSALSRKLNVAPGTMPGQVAYKLITMFGKPHFDSPAKSADPNDYQASVLSFITRATTGFEVFWEMKVEIRQNGKTIFSKETRHELVTYDTGYSWFDEASFLQHFSVLIDELLELRAPLAQKYILGSGIDYADLLRKNGKMWNVTKNPDLLGFGRPSFGPYTTLDAGKLDSPVVRMKKVLGTESGVTFYSDKTVSFDQFKTIDLTKKKVCFLELASGPDTLEAIYSINTRTIKQRRTFLSDLLSNDNDENNLPPTLQNRNIIGIIRTDTIGWQFLIQSYHSDGTISGGYLTNDQHNFQLLFKFHKGSHWEIITVGKDGEYFASLDARTSGSDLLIKNDLDSQTTHAIAVLYAVLMSTRNVQ